MILKFVTPKHYRKGLPHYEPIKVIESWCEDSFSLGNAIKYISRAGHKDSIIKDLRKAIYYINRKHLTKDAKKFNQVVYDIEDVCKAWELNSYLSEALAYIADAKLDKAVAIIEEYIFYIKNKNIFNKLYYLFV